MAILASLLLGYKGIEWSVILLLNQIAINNNALDLL